MDITHSNTMGDLVKKEPNSLEEAVCMENLAYKSGNYMARYYAVKTTTVGVVSAGLASTALYLCGYSPEKAISLGTVIGFGMAFLSLVPCLIDEFLNDKAKMQYAARGEELPMTREQRYLEHHTT